MKLKTISHGVTGRLVVEVYDNVGQIVACISSNDDNNGIRIVSHHLDKHWFDDGTGMVPEVPAINITFNR